MFTYPANCKGLWHLRILRAVAAGVPSAIEPVRPARRIGLKSSKTRQNHVRQTRAAGCAPSTAGETPAATRSRAFTVVELMLAVAIMGIIVYALYSVFNQTQRALRTTQTQG